VLSDTAVTAELDNGQLHGTAFVITKTPQGTSFATFGAANFRMKP